MDLHRSGGGAGRGGEVEPGGREHEGAVPVDEDRDRDRCRGGGDVARRPREALVDDDGAVGSGDPRRRGGGEDRCDRARGLAGAERCDGGGFDVLLHRVEHPGADTVVERHRRADARHRDRARRHGDGAGHGVRLRGLPSPPPPEQPPTTIASAMALITAVRTFDLCTKGVSQPPVSIRRTSSSESGVTRASTSSPDSSTVSPRAQQDVVVADDRDERRVARHVEIADRLAGDRRVLGERDLDQAHVAALELEEPHEPPDAHGLVDERGDEVRGRHRQVDAPRLVEQPLVLRVVDAGDDARAPRTPAWRAAR